MGTKLERSYINLTTGETEEVEVDMAEDEFEDGGFVGIDDDDDWLEDEDEDNGAILIAMLVGIIVVALFGICCLFSGNKDED